MWLNLKMETVNARHDTKISLASYLSANAWRLGFCQTGSPNYIGNIKYNLREGVPSMMSISLKAYCIGCPNLYATNRMLHASSALELALSDHCHVS